MPIYEFECSGCGHRFDRLQKLSEADPTVCPACAAAKLHRLVSAPAFRLAGSGWYETDFKKDGEKKHNLAGTAAANAEGKSAASPEPAVAKPDATAKAAATAD
ncbi:MAG: FmdB family zinc ribbon protein [Rhodanobacter sp.]